MAMKPEIVRHAIIMDLLAHQMEVIGELMKILEIVPHDPDVAIIKPLPIHVPLLNVLMGFQERRIF